MTKAELIVFLQNKIEEWVNKDTIEEFDLTVSADTDPILEVEMKVKIEQVFP